MTAGSRQVSATFWLLDAPDSLETQGRRNRDGTGLGFFTTSGRPIVDKQPEPAYSDVEFIRDARIEASTTFVAHVRIATNSRLSVENTHPFAMDGRIMAHNGGFEELAALEAELGDDMERVRGDTDSERYFALITKRIAEHDGDVAAGVTAAVRWLAEHVPLYSLNMVLVTENDLWALRYPEHHRLYVLRRPVIDRHGRMYRAASPTMRLTASEIGLGETVVVASEPLDEHSDWRLMESGELMHVGPDLAVDSQFVIAGPPKRSSIDPLPYVP